MRSLFCVSWLACALLACSAADGSPTTSAAPALTPAPAQAPRWVEFGVEGARFRFDVPEPFSVRANHVLERDGVAVVAAGRAGVIGMTPHAGRGTPNTMTAVADDKNLGFDHAQPITTDVLAAYGEVMKARFAGAGEPRVVTIGNHRAIAVDLGAPTAPVATASLGRHYLLLEDNAAIALECLWQAGDEAVAKRACDHVAASMTTTRWHTALGRMFSKLSAGC